MIIADGPSRLSVPFRWQGLDGEIRVRVRPNDDPRATGHHEIAPNFDEEAFRGFPLTTADVDYPGEGPRGRFAWIQWITHGRSGRVLAGELDTPPWLDGPFYVIGYRPTFADAPSNPDHVDLDWVATTYLTVTERPANADPGSPEVLVPLVGFVWGYRRATGPRTELLRPIAVGDRSWAELDRSSPTIPGGPPTVVAIGPLDPEPTGARAPGPEPLSRRRRHLVQHIGGTPAQILGSTMLSWPPRRSRRLPAEPRHLGWVSATNSDGAASWWRSTVRGVGERNYLVEGVSGAGKTTVAEELERRGYQAVHGDRVLARPGDPTTGRVLDEPITGWSLEQRHRHYIWDVAQVTALVTDRSRPLTFFCGGSRNSAMFLHLFDGVFVLEVDRETLDRRLDVRPPDEFGNVPEERALVLRVHRSREDLPAGGVSIDATRPVTDVVDEILCHVEKNAGRDLPTR